MRIYLLLLSLVVIGTISYSQHRLNCIENTIAEQVEVEIQLTKTLDDLSIKISGNDDLLLNNIEDSKEDIADIKEAIHILDKNAQNDRKFVLQGFSYFYEDLMKVENKINKQEK